MRILFISAEPMRSNQANATHITEIAKGLTSAGHEVMLCYTPSMGPYERTSLMRRTAGYALFWFQALTRLHQATLVYARAHPANFPITMIARLMRLPVVQEINGSYHDVSITHNWLSPLMGFVVALYRLQYRRANALITVTTALADYVTREAPGVPVHIVANGVNCEIFNPKRPQVRVATNDYALFFGSLTRWHGIETMLAAIENDLWPEDIDLVIVGDGQLSAMVQQASTRNAKIHALTSIPQATLSGYITGATMGIVPINAVGGRGKFGLSPLKLYEMLACALPVVVTDFPQQADLVRSLEAGLVIPSDDPAALARAIAALRENPPARDKMLKVASIIAAEHSWSNRVAKIDKILRRLVEQ